MLRKFFYVSSALSFALSVLSFAAAQEKNNEPIEMSVVIVNPSKTKTQSVPIKMDLPKEVTPAAIIDAAGLEVEFDTERSIYYLYKESVLLKPGETRTYNVEIRDVWFVPQGDLDDLRTQAELVVNRFEGSEFYDMAKKLLEAIGKSLDTIARTQNDQTVSRRRHIGIYRDNMKIVNQVRADIAMLENKLMLPKAKPVPEVLETEVKTDAPSRTTTWMIIFIIMLFVGMLAGVFFFTWQTQAHFTKDLISNTRNLVFPKKGGSPQDQQKSEKGQ